MKAHVTVNIVDVWELVRRHAAEKGIELTGLTVKTYNRVLINITDSETYGTMMEEPVRHRLNEEHSELNLFA